MNERDPAEEIAVLRAALAAERLKGAAFAELSHELRTLIAGVIGLTGLLLDTEHGAVVVPAAALRHGPQGDFVFVVTPDHIAHVRRVQTGPATGDRIAIASGLDAGEQVVTEGGDRLTVQFVVRGHGLRIGGLSLAQTGLKLDNIFRQVVTWVVALR